MSKNYSIVISYEGTDFYGWQEAPGKPTIEGSLKASLEKILNHPVELQAASRTDRGVHAHRQTVNFFSPKSPRLESINALLPPSIRVLEIKEEASSFHPTVDVVGKQYLYRVETAPIQLPFERHLAWHLYGPFDLEAAKQAVKYLVGTHDFAAFCNVHEGKTYSSTVRTLWWCNIETRGSEIWFDIAGNHFLYKMVRNLVGTLAAVGRGQLKRDDIKIILENRDRTEAGLCAPAHGLTLNNVFYKHPNGYST